MGTSSRLCCRCLQCSSTPPPLKQDYMKEAFPWVHWCLRTFLLWNPEDTQWTWRSCGAWRSSLKLVLILLVLTVSNVLFSVVNYVLADDANKGTALWMITDITLVILAAPPVAAGVRIFLLPQLRDFQPVFKSYLDPKLLPASEASLKWHARILNTCLLLFPGVGVLATAVGIGMTAAQNGRGAFPAAIFANYVYASVLFSLIVGGVLPLVYVAFLCLLLAQQRSIALFKQWARDKEPSIRYELSNDPPATYGGPYFPSFATGKSDVDDVGGDGDGTAVRNPLNAAMKDKETKTVVVAVALGAPTSASDAGMELASPRNSISISNRHAHEASSSSSAASAEADHGDEPLTVDEVLSLHKQIKKVTDRHSYPWAAIMVVAIIWAVILGLNGFFRLYQHMAMQPVFYIFMGLGPAVAIVFLGPLGWTNSKWIKITSFDWSKWGVAERLWLVPQLESSPPAINVCGLAPSLYAVVKSAAISAIPLGLAFFTLVTGVPLPASITGNGSSAPHCPCNATLSSTDTHFLSPRSAIE